MNNPSTKKYATGDRAVEVVKAYLEEHYARVFKLDDLAELTGFDKYYLRSLFKRHTGHSPHAYQQEMRLEQAKTLLEQGVTAAEVASRVGFSDQSHLNRIFQKRLGMTAGRYQYLKSKP